MTDTDLNRLRQEILRAASYEKVEKDGRVDALTKSMADAVYAASSKPDQEVRMYFKNHEDVTVTVDTIMHTCKHWVDVKATAKNAGKEAVIEFKNGSCIRLLSETRAQP